MADDPKTKNVIIYEELRQGIIKGQLKPGQRPVIRDACERWPSVFSYVSERAMRSFAEHEDIIAALSYTDIEKKEGLMRKQKERTYNSLKNYMLQSALPFEAKRLASKLRRPVGQILR